MDDQESRMQEADIKVESPSGSEWPEKRMERAGSCGGAQLHSPPLNNGGEKESKSPSKAVVRMRSFHRGISKSLTERSTKDPAVLRYSKLFAKRSSKHIEERARDTKENSRDPKGSGESGDNCNKREPLSEEHQKTPSGFPEKSTESQDSLCAAPLTPPPLNGGGEKAASPSKPLTTALSFGRGLSQSVSGKEPGILRSSKRFANRSIRWIENRVHAHKENTNGSEEPEGGGITKEPLSVMEINKLIQTRQLLEAFEHIKNLETELLAERDAKKHEDNPREDALKAKDVELLYDHISEVIREIVQETLDHHPSLDERALTSLVTLIGAEEKAHPEATETTVSSGPVPLGSARNWRALWKEAVHQSVAQRVRKVPIPLREDNAAWLSVHLGFLRTVIKEDLLKIKLQGHKCYPQDYNVWATYMGAFHTALSLHLHDILDENSLTFREFYALLHWITHICHSEEFLGHPDLKPEINTEDLPDLLTPEAMDKLRHDYINSLKEQTKMYLDNILMLQTKRNWNSEEQPEVLQIQDHSLFSLDIQMMIGQHMKASGDICDSLKNSTLEISLKEVTEFMQRFKKAFLEWDKEHDHPRFVEFMVIHINDSHDLLTGLERNFGVSCQELEKALNDAVLSYRKHFFHKLRVKTQPLFKEVLSRQWLLRGGTPDSFIMKALSATEEFSEPLIHLKKPFYKQDFHNGIHKYVVKEYITQTLKSKGRRRRRRKWEEISKLMKQEATVINNTMIQLGSSSDWLFPAIPHIAGIIGAKKKRNVKDCLTNLSQDYPDIRREHILALLALRGGWRTTRQAVADQINHLSDGLETGSDRTLFAEIELPNTTWCF